MSLILRIALIIVVLLFILLILKSIRRKKMNITFSLIWIVIGVLLIIAAIVPHFIENVSKAMGFETPSNMLFCVTIFIAFCLILNLTSIASMEHKKNTILIQEVSILKKRVEELEKKDKGE